MREKTPIGSKKLSFLSLLVAVGLLAITFGITLLATEPPVLAAALRATAPAPKTRTFRDDRGADVKVAGTPKRVAAISAFGADLLYALGLRLPVAVTDIQGHLPTFLGRKIKGVPSLGQRTQPNLELLAESRPDLILAIRRYTEPFADKLEKIAPYAAFELTTYQDSLRAVEVAADMLGQKAEGRRLNQEFERKMEEYRKRAPGGISAVFLWGGGEAPSGYYDHYMTTAILRNLKAENIVGASPTPHLVRPFAIRLSLEQLLKKDPDVIFVLFLQPKEKLQVPNNPIWPRLKAVKSGRVYEVGMEWIEVHGPIARDVVLEQAAHFLYPDVFSPPKPRGQ
ncbi:MAG: ABC transporter substrate-binding protein [Candidatus Methylomirabilales bacterium]